MTKLSNKDREKWSFFINPLTHKRQYYPQCRRCIHDCKQSFRVKEQYCPRFEPQKSKRVKKREDAVENLKKNR